MKLTKNQYEILVRMDTEWCYSFSHFEELGLAKKQLSAEFKILRELGLVEFHKTLVNDEGVAGSGYGLPYGREQSEKRQKLLEEYETSLPNKKG